MWTAANAGFVVSPREVLCLLLCTTYCAILLDLFHSCFEVHFHLLTFWLSRRILDVVSEQKANTLVCLLRLLFSMM